MATTIPTVSTLDSIRFNVFHMIPYLTRGIFTENRSWVRFWAKFQRDPGAVRLIGRLRKKYKSDYLYINVLGNKSLLVLANDGIKRILDQSPMIYAEARPKRERMSHFQPNALTISRGEEWRDRREFNTSVLHGRTGVHPHADRFLEIIRGELTQKGNALQSWDDFDKLFERITLQVIFGKGVDDAKLTDALKSMMLESNKIRFSSKKSKHFDGFYKKIGEHLASAPESSLVSLCRHAPSTTITKIESQIPHWMFAMKDTLAINIVRALALIISHPEVEKRVREEIAHADLSSAQDIAGLRYLQACIQEAMRLWPTTLMLIRESLVEDTISDVVIPANTQIIIHNGFNHRNVENYDFADKFVPDVWLKQDVNYQFNHLSNGAQVCAGKDLALYIGKAVLATLLGESRYRLHKPSLKSEQPLPYVCDHYGIALERIPF